MLGTVYVRARDVHSLPVTVPRSDYEVSIRSLTNVEGVSLLISFCYKGILIYLFSYLFSYRFRQNTRFSEDVENFYLTKGIILVTNKNFSDH